jgi:hypothetical protein
MEIQNKLYPNFQIPIKSKDFESDELWKFKIRKLNIETDFKEKEY